MATKDYFNRIHRKIVQNTGASTSLRNQNELNSFLNRVRQDIANLTNYVNEIVYPIFQGPGMDISKESILCWGPKWEFDAVLDGLAATTLQTFPEEHGGGPYAPECYWFDDGLGGGRPRSIKETFDCLMAMISEQQVLIQEKEPDLSDIYEQLQCLAANDERIVKDSFGCNYNLTCSDTHTKEWPIGKHIFEIFNQIISGHGNLSELGIADPVAGIEADPNVCSGTPYPDLHITINQSDVFPDICIEPWKICGICDPDGWDPGGAGSSIADDIREIVLRIGGVAGVSPGGSPTYCLGPALESACFNAINNKSLSEAIELIAEELCNKCEAAYDQVYLSEDGGTVNNDLVLATETCDGTLEFIAGPNIILTGTAGDPDQIKIEATNWVPTGILGNLNDAYHFPDNPFFHFGIIALENTYENVVANNNNWSAACVPKPGAGIYLMDDTTELKSKLFAIVSDAKLSGSNYIDPNGPTSAYFSVGDHWGLESLKEQLASGNISQSEFDMQSRAWDKYKVVHTEDSIFYTKLVKNYDDNVFLPKTAGFNNNGSINPETGLPGQPHHGITCPDEGAIWISEGHEATNPNFPADPILDGCDNPLEAGHLYYRMPGDGAVWKLSGCGGGGAGGNLQDAYDFDKDGDTQADGGRIMLRPDGEAQNRTFWLMQHSNFITPGLESDYWYTPGPPFTSTVSSPVDPNCPYYIPWFAVTDEVGTSNPDNPTGPVGPDDGIDNTSILDRFFSIQYRDQCFIPSEPEGCCCDFDENGNPTNPQQEWLYEIGGIWNLRPLQDCYTPPNCDFTNAMWWLDPNGIPVEHTGIKTVQIYETQCFWVDLFPIYEDETSNDPQTSYTCWQVQAGGDAVYQIDYSCQCVIDVDGVPTTHVLVRDVTQNPYAAFGAAWRIDERCLPCCADFADPSQIFMAPLWHMPAPNTLVGQSTVPVPLGEHMESVYPVDPLEGPFGPVMYDPNGLGTPTHIVPPVDVNGPCYWDPTLSGSCDVSGFSLLGYPVNVSGVPLGGTLNPPGSLARFVSEDTLAAAGMVPGDKFGYYVDDCAWVSYDLFPSTPEIDSRLLFSMRCTETHEYEVTECYWTNDHVASMNMAGERWYDMYGQPWPGSKKFHGLLGPDASCDSWSRYWAADCYIFPLWVVLFGTSSQQSSMRNAEYREESARKVMARDDMTKEEVANALTPGVTFVRSGETGVHFSDQFAELDNIKLLSRAMDTKSLDDLAVNLQIFVARLRDYVLSDSFSRSPFAAQPSKLLDPNVFRDMLILNAHRKEFGAEEFVGDGLPTKAMVSMEKPPQERAEYRNTTRSGGDGEFLVGSVMEDCDYYIWAETVQDPGQPNEGEFRIHYQGGNIGRDLCSLQIKTNDLGVDFVPAGDDISSVIGGDAANWNKITNLTLVGEDLWGVACPGSPSWPGCLSAPANPSLLISWKVQTAGGGNLPSAVIDIRDCVLHVKNEQGENGGGIVVNNSPPLCPPTVEVQCCNANGNALPNQDIYLNTRVNYNGETLPLIEIWFNTPDPNGVFAEGVHSFETIVDCFDLRDAGGYTIWQDWYDPNTGNGCIFNAVGRPSWGSVDDIVGGEAFNNDWFFEIDNTVGSQSQFLIKGTRVGPYVLSDCIPPTDGMASSPCEPDYDGATTEHTLLVALTPGNNTIHNSTTCYGIPFQSNSGHPMLEACSACACVLNDPCPSGYGIPTHCCGWHEDTSPPAAGSELVFKPIPGNYDGQNNPTSIDIYMSLNQNVTWDEISVVEFTLDTTCLMNADGTSGTIPPPIDPADLVAGAIKFCDWQYSINPIANTNKVQVIAWVDENSSCPCIPKPDVSISPCSRDMSDKVLLASFQVHPFNPVTSSSCIMEYPVLTGCDACSYCPAEPECTRGICCLDQPNPSVPGDCTPWPSVHFWQSPAYFTCMPLGWAPNTCEQEGVVWVGAKSVTAATGSGSFSNQLSGDVTAEENCTIYFREPGNGAVHDLTAGLASGGSVGMERFTRFNAGALDEGLGSGGTIVPADKSYLAGVNDNFKLYGLNGIELVTEDAVDANGIPILPGNENAIGIRVYTPPNYPSTTYVQAYPHSFEVTFSSTASTGYQSAVPPITGSIITAFGNKMVAMYDSQYQNQGVLRELDTLYIGALDEANGAMAMVHYNNANSDSDSEHHLAFSTLSVAPSVDSTVMAFNRASHGGVELSFNSNEICLTDLKDTPTDCGLEPNMVLTTQGSGDCCTLEWTHKTQGVNVGAGTNIIKAANQNSLDGNSIEIRSIEQHDVAQDPFKCIQALTPDPDMVTLRLQGYLGGNGNASCLLDVDPAMAPTNGHVLTWDQNTSQWTSSPGTGGGGSMAFFVEDSESTPNQAVITDQETLKFAGTGSASVLFDAASQTLTVDGSNTFCGGLVELYDSVQGTKVAKFDGDIDVTGVIDPTAIVLKVVTDAPAADEEGAGQLFVKDDHQLYFRINGTEISLGSGSDDPEVDPVFVGSPASAILSEHIAAWHEAFGWGDHSAEGYLVSTGVLSSHTDVSESAPATGDVLKWNGSQWSPMEDASGGGGAFTVTGDAGTTTVESGDVLITTGDTGDKFGVKTVVGNDTLVISGDEEQHWGQYHSLYQALPVFSGDEEESGLNCTSGGDNAIWVEEVSSSGFYVVAYNTNAPQIGGYSFTIPGVNDSLNQDSITGGIAGEYGLEIAYANDTFNVFGLAGQCVACDAEQCLVPLFFFVAAPGQNFNVTDVTIADCQGQDLGFVGGSPECFINKGMILRIDRENGARVLTNGVSQHFYEPDSCMIAKETVALGEPCPAYYNGRAPVLVKGPVQPGDKIFAHPMFFGLGISESNSFFSQLRQEYPTKIIGWAERADQHGSEQMCELIECHLTFDGGYDAFQNGEAGYTFKSERELFNQFNINPDSITKAEIIQMATAMGMDQEPYNVNFNQNKDPLIDSIQYALVTQKLPMFENMYTWLDIYSPEAGMQDVLNGNVRFTDGSYYYINDLFIAPHMAYYSSNDAVATVNEVGIISYHSAGTVIITAEFRPMGKPLGSATKSITVKESS